MVVSVSVTAVSIRSTGRAAGSQLIAIWKGSAGSIAMAIPETGRERAGSALHPLREVRERHSRTASSSFFYMVRIVRYSSLLLWLCAEEEALLLLLYIL